MNKNEVFETALRIAVIAHAGQKDKLGYPYILHPLAVASQLDSLDLKTVALLHDVIEDTSVTDRYLLDSGIPKKLVESVMILTKPKDMSYESYLERVKTDPVALAVKKADLAHNTSSNRSKGLNSDRKAKYNLAKEILSNPNEKMGVVQKKADLYDKMIETRRKGAQKTNNISPEQRRLRAKKAAAARWGK